MTFAVLNATISFVVINISRLIAPHFNLSHHLTHAADHHLIVHSMWHNKKQRVPGLFNLIKCCRMQQTLILIPFSIQGREVPTDRVISHMT